MSNDVRDEALYDELPQIAPTVLAEEVGAVWKDDSRLAGEALGVEDEAEEVLTGCRESAAAVGEAIGDPASTTVSPLRFVEGGIRAYTSESSIGTVLTDVGLSIAELPEGEFPAFAELSPEQLTLADADIVLYSSYGAPADSGEGRPSRAAVVAPRRRRGGPGHRRGGRRLLHRHRPDRGLLDVDALAAELPLRG